MLNISPNNFDDYFDEDSYESLRRHKGHHKSLILRITVIILVILFVVMFLPWTQNIRSKGYVTTRFPDQKPQMVQSVLSGRIEKWFVKEGDYVKKGDTLLFISEVKDKYFSPEMLFNLKQQIERKTLSIEAYGEKAKALNRQINALIKAKALKMQQSQNYLLQAKLQVKTDSMNLVASQTNLDIAQRQYERTENLYKSGLKSRTELETKQMKFQSMQAKFISSENKLLAARNKLENAQIAVDAVEVEYIDKISKSQSNRHATFSSMYDAQSSVSKMQNTYEGYLVRRDLYYIRAPKDIL